MSVSVPITNPKFSGAVDFNSTKASGVAGLSMTSGASASIGRSKEIYIAYRTDGITGTGTALDPYDGSTRLKFDTLLASLSGTQGLTIYIGVGTFVTRGSYAWLVRPKWRILGSGMYSTILQLDPSIGVSVSGGIRVISSPDTGPDVNVNGAQVKNLTVDCNYPNMISLPIACALTGSILGGDNNLQENVRCINGYGNFTGGAEHFGIGCTAAAGTTCYNSKVINCVAETVWGDYGSALNLSGNSGLAPFVAVGGRMSGNTVRNYRNASIGAPNYGGVFHGGGCDGGVMENNTFVGCVSSIYLEQGKDLVIQNNTILDSWQFGVHLFANTIGISNVKIQNNTVEMRDDDPTRCWAIASQGDDLGGDQIVNNVTISENTLKLKITGNTPGSEFFSIVGAPDTFDDVTFYFGLGFKVIGNSVDENFNSFQLPSDSLFANNRSLTNSTIPAMPDSTASAPINTKNSSLSGALLLQATFSNIDGYVQYQIPGVYTIVSGDAFEMEVFCSEADVSFIPDVKLHFSTDATESGGMVDQNNLHMGSDFPATADSIANYAKGTWYRRTGSLEDYVGKTTDFLGINSSPAAVGSVKDYFRHIRIVSSTGARRIAFYEEAELLVAIALGSAPVHATNYSIGVVPVRGFLPITTSPAQITANTNNYNPGVAASIFYLRLNTDASRNLTGLAYTPAQVDGQTHIIINSGAQDIVLVNQSASSTSVNRFLNTTGADITLTAKQQAYVFYDSTTGFWRVSKMN